MAVLDSALHRRLDIVAVLSHPPEAGGGFHQSLNSLATLTEACRERHRLRVVGLDRTRLGRERLNLLIPGSAEIEWVTPPPPGAAAVLKRLPPRIRRSHLIRLVRRILQRRSTAEFFLDALDADVVYFLSPNTDALRLHKTAFIMTVWDVCHLDFPEFPEVRANGEFNRREAMFRGTLTQAALVVTDSEVLADRIHQRYGVDRSRLLTQHFRPSPFILAEGAVPTQDVVRRYGLEKGYWFYPAQFWAHKNHVRVLEALAILRDRGARQTAVFCGSDQGSLERVQAHARLLGVTDDIRILGFVPSEHLRGLYEAAIGLVFPSYFGPTNLPPLEAISLGIPVVCSDFHERTLGRGPGYFDPDDAEMLADRMLEVVRAAPEKAHPPSGAYRGEARDLALSDAASTLRARLDVLSARLAMLRTPAGMD